MKLKSDKIMWFIYLKRFYFFESYEQWMVKKGVEILEMQELLRSNE